MSEQHDRGKEDEDRPEPAGRLLAAGSPDEVLNELVIAAERAVGAAGAVSITVPKRSTHTTTAASRADIYDVDDAQYRLGGGPCVAAASDGVTTYIPDITLESRWRGFAEKAASKGIGSAFSVPLRAGGQLFGSLNFYAYTKDAFAPEQQRAATDFVERFVYEIANAHEHARVTKENADLKQALESRDLIGTAKGILMEREGVSDEEAFNLLVTASQRANRKLRDVAEELVRRAQTKGR